MKIFKPFSYIYSYFFSSSKNNTETLATKPLGGTPDPLTRNTDALGDFMEQLEKERISLNQHLDTWKNHKEKLIEQSLFLLNEIISKHETPPIRPWLKVISDQIKMLFQSPEKNVDDVLKKIDPSLNELKNHLTQLEAKLSDLRLDPSHDKKEEDNVRLNICDTCISLIDEQMIFIDTIQSQLLFELERKNISKDILCNIAQITMTLLFHIKLPDFKFDFNLQNRTELSRQIKEEEFQIHMEETVVNGTILKAEKGFEISDDTTKETAVIKHGSIKLFDPPPSSVKRTQSDQSLNHDTISTSTLAVAHH